MTTEYADDEPCSTRRLLRKRAPSDPAFFVYTYLDPEINRAEVALTVHDRWQRKVIGTFLFKHLTRIAMHYGIKGFTAEVLPQNSRMLKVFQRSKLNKRSRTEGGVVSWEFDFSPMPWNKKNNRTDRV